MLKVLNSYFYHSFTFQIQKVITFSNFNYKKIAKNSVNFLVIDFESSGKHQK